MTKPFDRDVKVGELRILADVSRPVVVLIAEDRGAFGFRVIPVSDYTAVNCEGEQSVGNRIYQHWNACNVPRAFALRSWLVDPLPDSEFKAIRNCSLFTTHSSLASLSSYQRAHLFSLPNPLASSESKVAHHNFSLLTSHFSLLKTAGFALAACVVLALVFAVRLDLDRAAHKEERAHAWQLVMKPGEAETLEAEETESDEADAVVVAGQAPEFGLTPPDGKVMEREPEINGSVAAPTMANLKDGVGPRSVAIDRYDAAVMRALPRRTVDDHAIAVMTYLACGVGSSEKEFGGRFVSSAEKLVESVKAGAETGEYTRRLVATALCRAYVATNNPDLKSHAETALDGLGDKRPVEVIARGYDLVESWFESRREYRPAEVGSVAQPVPYPAWFKFIKAK